MSAKELKAIADIGITLGYSGDELKQFVNDERMRMDKEKEQERQRKEGEEEAERMRKEKEAEIERKAKEKEAEKLESQARDSQSHAAVDGSGVHTASHVPNIKARKLPPFHEDKNDLDAYLNRFERTCRAFNVSQEQWSFQLARFLQGQALDVYQRMSDEDVGDYELLKNNILKRFRLTEGGYHKRFKHSNIENGETP